MNQLRPHQVFGGYELERKLGLGGMAEVWLAHPISPGSSTARVVVKRVHPHLAEDKVLVSLFMDEVRLVQQLKHPNVVRVFDGGKLGDDWYLAMEYIDGIDLRNAIEAHGGPLWPALAASLVADACAGLHYAHAFKDRRGKALRVVHRDVAPDNVMVDRTGQVRLVDFGIARAESTEVTTRTGLRKGKVRYMAPEYLSDHHADPCSDVYSMGATLFELATGQKPFGHIRATAAVYTAILKEGLPRASTVRPSLPADLVDIIAAATTRDSFDRLRSARALELRLRAFLESFQPPSRSEIGSEVSFWKQKLAGGPLRPKSRESGSFGQLETTEMIRSEFAAEARRKHGGPSAVSVAHQLDDTQFEIRLGDFASLDADTDRNHAAPDGVESVILDPQLEAVSERRPAPVRRSKKKTRKSSR